MSPSGPPAVPSPGALACSADISRVSLDGQPVAVTYPPPALDTRPLDKATCTPASGSLFPAGRTTRVTCQASEAPALVTACSFDVTITIPPRLSKSRLMAFGDSITEGYICDGCLAGPGAGQPGQWFGPQRGLSPRLVSDPATSYPTQLQLLVNARYPAQTILVTNRGLQGEWASEGRLRLASEIDAHRPDLLLLLEGVNDLMAATVRSPGQAVSVVPVANALRQMVDIALARGVDVVIATLTPVSDARDQDWPGLKAGIDALNGEIRRIASDRNLGPPVDLFSEISRDMSLIGADGLHPTAAGYKRMAETFLWYISARFEHVTSAAGASSLLVVSGAGSPR